MDSEHDCSDSQCVLCHCHAGLEEDAKNGNFSGVVPKRDGHLHNWSVRKCPQCGLDH